MKTIFLILILSVFSVACKQTDSKEYKREKTIVDSSFLHENKTIENKVEINSKDKPILDSFFPENDEIIENKVEIDSTRYILIKRESLQSSNAAVYELELSDTIRRDTYRNYRGIIEMYLLDSLAYSVSFLKEDFPQIGDDEFLKIAIIQGIWFNSYDSVNSKLKCDLSISKPETDYSYHFSLYISENGNLESELESIE